LYSEPEACRQIASIIKAHVPWLENTRSNEDGQGGLILTLYGNRSQVLEVLGLKECYITLAAVIRLEIAFEKEKKPPNVRKLYCLAPNIMLVNPERENAWSGVDLGSIAHHFGMKEDELHEVISPGRKVFRSESLAAIAKEYAHHLLTVEENLGAIILSNYLTKEPI
jgi:hypothetical protein